MDPRTFNVSVLVGLLMVFLGLGLGASWPLALVVTGLLVFWGTFKAATLALGGGE